MMTDAEKALIRDSWRVLAPIAESAVDLFYRRLAELEPASRELSAELGSRRTQELVSALNFTVKSLDWAEAAWRDDPGAESDLFFAMFGFGKRAGEFERIAHASEEAVAAAFLWTLDYALGQKFDAPCRAAWTHLYALTTTAMRMGKASQKAGADARASLDGMLPLLADTEHERGGLS